MEENSVVTREVQDWVRNLARARFSYLVKRGVTREMAKKEALALANRLLEAFESRTLSYLGPYEEPGPERTENSTAIAEASRTDYEQRTLWDN